MYQALYRKWRPKRFEDVVGQAHVTETLRRQVESGRLSHAYLFVGTRGTGKTTCAKILAKAVNCEHPINGDPCCECASCRGIDSGAILDVEELDAASNNGVDNIRALRDEAVFTPATVRKRVYIIDEVHMLSASAFNALLKILEEPPEHLIFILATTELRKVPPTILSRCQRFSFKRITPEDIRARLLYVAEKENIDLTGGAADLLSRLADGALRDALSLLDQCSGGGTVDEDRVMSAIGLAGNDETMRMLDAVGAHDVSSALEILDSLYFNGKDAGSVLKELCALMRDILIIKIAPKSADKLISGAFSREKLTEYSKSLPTGFLIDGIGTLQASAGELTQSADKRTATELCLIRLALPKEAKAAPQYAAPIPADTAAPVFASSAPAAKKAEPTKKQDLPPWDFAEPASKAPVPNKEAPPAPNREAPAAAQDVPAKAASPIATAALSGDLWGDILKAVRHKIGPASFSFLSDKTHADAVIENGCVEIMAKTDFVAGMIDTPEVLNAVRDEARRIIGHAVRVKVAVGTVKKDIQSDKLDELSKFGNVTII